MEVILVSNKLNAGLMFLLIWTVHTPDCIYQTYLSDLSPHSTALQLHWTFISLLAFITLSCGCHWEPLNNSYQLAHLNTQWYCFGVLHGQFMVKCVHEEGRSLRKFSAFCTWIWLYKSIYLKKIFFCHTLFVGVWQ